MRIRTRPHPQAYAQQQIKATIPKNDAQPIPIAIPALFGSFGCLSKNAKYKSPPSTKLKSKNITRAMIIVNVIKNTLQHRSIIHFCKRFGNHDCDKKNIKVF